ncbi:hypothetical protein [Streptomyces fulvorobeus]|uniref:Uncharacterized protein n=1 Tax=Streptomyces fulvorobeus TaxID=284028 RepID=A0A7J0C8A9_9ACTN|nr:hypothetical protein [Streptomyces fulvorobeus]NYE41733.1 hypothetical protein [Streptomyces fulvorobeus]GFM98104.1 hypothetical protein Sfulv_29150 [Streptomyces fulvorobeus]
MLLPSSPSPSPFLQRTPGRPARQLDWRTARGAASPSGIPWAGAHLPLRALSADRADRLRDTVGWLRYCGVRSAIGSLVLLVLAVGAVVARAVLTRRTAGTR